MAEDVDRWLGSSEGRDGRDHRNGTHPRRLLCELGDIGLEVPRTRRYCPTAVPGSDAYAREIVRVILDGFVLGLSTRRIGEVLLPCLGGRSRPPPNATGMCSIRRATGPMRTADRIVWKPARRIGAERSSSMSAGQVGGPDGQQDRHSNHYGAIPTANRIGWKPTRRTDDGSPGMPYRTQLPMEPGRWMRA